MTTRRVRFAMLGIGLAGAMMFMRSGDVPVNAQESNRGEDAAVQLAGRKVRFDKKSGKLRDLSQQEARELVATLTAMTTRTERPVAATSRWRQLVQQIGRVRSRARRQAERERHHRCEVRQLARGGGLLPLSAADLEREGVTP